MTLGLAGLTLYLFCVHSFKLPIAAGGIAIGILGVMTTRQGFTFPAPVLAFAAFLLWSTTGLVTSEHRDLVGSALVDYLKILLILFVAINSVRSRSQLAIFVGVWVLIFGAYPARGTYLNFFAGIGDFGRYAWNFTFSNFNDLAAYAILTMALSGFLLIGRYAKWIRVGALLSTIGLALLIVLTQSRGAFIGLTVGFFFMLLRSRNRKRLLQIGSMAALAIVLAAPGAVWERFSKMKYLFATETLGEADSSAEQRYVILQVAASIAREHPGTGVGLGAYAETHRAYAEERQEWAFGGGERDAHNMYLSLAAETGVIGLLLFLSIAGVTIRKSLRTEIALRSTFPTEAEQLRVLRFGLVAFLIAAIFGSLHRVPFMYLYVAALWTACEQFADGLGAAQLAHAGAPGSAYGLTEALPVGVKVSPVNLQDVQAKTLNFTIVLDTHSVELAIDFAKTASLQVGDVKVEPTAWVSASRKGHHIEGVLSFPATDAKGKSLLTGVTTLTLVLQGLPDGKESTFTWDLTPSATTSP